jgi:ABC-type branched-subunit amino acid transport system ATPase component
VSLLQISRVTKRYSGVAAVNDVSLAIDRGSIVALIGPNGAGKSTFLGVVAGARSRPIAVRFVSMDAKRPGLAALRLREPGLRARFRAFGSSAISRRAKT